MAAWEDEFEELFWETMDHEKEDKMELAKRLINLADEHKDIERGIIARKEYIEGACFCDLHKLAFPMLAWCFARIDENELLSDEYEYGLVWQYKWIIAGIGDWLSIKRDDVMALHRDIIKRVKKIGDGDHTTVGLEIQIAFEFGDEEGVKQHLEKWANIPPDALSDCAACVQDRKVQTLTWVGRNEEALQQAEEIQSGKLTCAEVPEVSWIWITVASIELGKTEMLSKCYNGLSRAKSKLAFNGSIRCGYLWLSALLDKGKESRRYLNKILQKVDEDENDSSRMWTYYGCYCALRNLKSQGVTSSKILGVSIDEAIASMQEKAYALIDAFDKRNGSLNYRNWFARMENIFQSYAEKANK